MWIRILLRVYFFQSKQELITTFELLEASVATGYWLSSAQKMEGEQTKEMYLDFTS